MYFRSLQKNKDTVVLLLRLVVGMIFLVHGYMKFVSFENLPMTMQILAIAEPLGGIAIIAGVLTRWAGVGLGIIMLGAIYTKMSNVGLMGFAGQGGWEFDLLILMSCIVVMTMGPGKYSMDVKAGWDKA